MADLPSILGGLAQGFVDFGKSAVDMFGTGGAAIGDLIEGARTGKVTTKNQDDFRKWLYQTDSTKDAAAKGLGTTLNGVQTVLDYIPGVNVLTRNPLGNAAQGALGGLADEFKTYGEDYDLGRAGQRAAVSGAAAAASGSLADALKGSSNALLSSNTLQGLARGATGGAITGGGYAAIDGGDVLEAAKQGAGMGALIGGATGAFQDFNPANTYDVALTDDERAARIANAQKQIDDIGPIRRFTDDPNELAKRARVNELQDAIKAYQSGYDTVQDYNDALAARRANRQPSLTREEYEAKMQQRIRDLGGNYEVTPEKQAQFDRLQKVNPMRDDYHTGIRAPQDIATLQEAINNAKDIDPAYKSMLQKALADDSVTVYSSYPIEEGVFTTPIKQMAQDYAGPGNQVYSKTISPNDIAWIDDQEGNYIPRLQQLEATLADADMAVNNPRYLTDENGNPRTFYHGSPNKNITEFDINQAGKNTSSGEHALYFTDSPEVADEFSYERLPSDSMFVNNRGAKGRVYPVNLAMDNPLDLSNLSDKQIEELWQYASPLGKLDGKEKFIKNMKAFRDYGNDQLIKTNLDLDKLAGSQYDGFTARMYPNQGNQAREYAVFDNSKVKMLEDVLANDDMAVNSQAKSPDGAQNYRTFATGDEAREYFGNSNPGYWDKAPGYDDIQEYTRNGYSRVNDMLRTGQDNYGYPDTDIMIDNIERGIDGYDLKDDIKVYRKSNADVYKNLKVGDTFTDNGFTSASVTPEIGGDFGKANIEIDVGKGKGVGAFIGDLSSGNGDEGEFLLQRGTKFKVLGRDQDGILKLEVVGNERKPLEQILANQDLSVNSAKIAPGQLGLFDDMPTQTPKTGTRQTSLFDQPDNPYLDYYGADIDATPLVPETPANPYAPVSGEVTQAMRDRAADILGNWKKNGVPENELYNAINPDTLPDKVKSLKEIVDGGAYDKRMKELFGTTDIKKADIGKVIDYLYESEPARADNIKNNLLAERGLGKYEQRFRNRMKKSLYEAAQERIANDIGANGLASSKNIADVSIRQGYTAAADEALSERLGIAPGNTPKYNGAMDTRNAFGRYSHPSYREGGDLAVFERKMNSPEDAISTVAHERLHSFQGELEPRSKGRYDKEVLEAYEQLRRDLAPHYKSWDETAERYGHRDTGYWQSGDEQESRMLQNYLENKGYTDSTHMKSKYRAGEWGNEINPAFDKFFDKLRDLSKRGVALPALAALFGGGAYMASQENDKEKEVK